MGESQHVSWSLKFNPLWRTVVLDFTGGTLRQVSNFPSRVGFSLQFLTDGHIIFCPSLIISLGSIYLGVFLVAQW